MSSEAETFRALLLARRVDGTNQEFADRAGISLRALNKLLAGNVDTPRRATLLALAAALKVPPARVEKAIAASRAAKS